MSCATNMNNDLTDEEIHYQLFGIHISSNFELTELSRTKERNQALIRIVFCESTIQFQQYYSNSSEDQLVFENESMYLHIPNIAQYFLKKTTLGIHIYVCAYPQAQRLAVLSWLYGSMLTAALQLCDRYALHASGVIYQDQLYLFAGNSGRGKSTIAASLVDRGFLFFTDDKCVIEQDHNNKLFARSSFNIMRLWRESEENLDTTGLFDHAEKILVTKDKKQMIVNDQFRGKSSYEIGAIFILGTPTSTDDYVFRSLAGVTKVMALRNNTHRLAYVKKFNRTGQHWSHITNLSKSLDVYLVRRPKDATIDSFALYMKNKIIQIRESV